MPEADDFLVRFWGVRGSIACPGPNYARYGGNTSCLEVRCGPNNRFHIFYDVHSDERVVVVLAIARKEGSSLFIGKEKFQL